MFERPADDLFSSDHCCLLHGGRDTGLCHASMTAYSEARPDKPDLWRHHKLAIDWHLWCERKRFTIDDHRLLGKTQAVAGQPEHRVHPDSRREIHSVVHVTGSAIALDSVRHPITAFDGSGCHARLDNENTVTKAQRQYPMMFRENDQRRIYQAPDRKQRAEGRPKPGAKPGFFQPHPFQKNNAAGMNGYQQPIPVTACREAQCCQEQQRCQQVTRQKKPPQQPAAENEKCIPRQRQTQRQAKAVSINNIYILAGY